MFPVTSITLNQNTISTALFNMIISQRVFDSKVASTELADKFRVDGTLYGDTKLYHSFDIGAPEDWLNDGEAADLLKLNRNKSGKTQSVKFGIYQMVYVTIDAYLSKQAFMYDGTFAEFNGFLTSSLRKAKKVYDRSLINSKLGTLTPSTPDCDITIAKRTAGAGNVDVEATNRLEAQDLAARLVVLKADLADNNRKYNKLNYLRSFDSDEFIAIWNVEKHAKITKLDLPTIFHNDINEGGGFKEYDLPAKWFGDINDSSDLTLPANDGEYKTSKSRIVKSGWYKVSDAGNMTMQSKPDDKSVYLWAGDKVPYTGQVIEDYARGKKVTVNATKLEKGMYYVENGDIAFVLVHREALPFMSAFEVETEFWNGRSLTSNHYLIFGHNELEFLEEYPRIRFKIA